MLLIAFIINVVALILSVVFASGAYSSLDDFFMANALTGAYDGVLNAHLYFVNAIYGYLLMPLYSLLPKVGWYGLFELLAIFISFTSITYVVLNKLGGKVGGALAAMVLCCVSTDFYLHVGFTQCAAALTASGILLVCSGYMDRRKVLLVLGTILMAWGFVMRKEMFLLGMPTLCAMLFFSVWRTHKVYIPAIVALVLCFAAVAGLKQFDKAHFTSDGYDTYAAFQGPRAFFGDGSFYDDEAVSDELDERGMFSRDFRMLKAWYFNDKVVFSLDSLKAIRQIVYRNTFDTRDRSIPVSLLNTLGGRLQKPAVWCWFMLCLFLIFFSSRKNGLIPWASIFIMCLSYEYLLQLNRVVGHVEAGIWLYASVLTLPFLDKDAILEKKLWVSFVQIAGLVALAGLFFASVNIAYNMKSDKQSSAVVAENVPDWSAFMNYAHENPNDVFVLSFGDYKGLASETGRPFVATPAGSWANIVSTGYWNFNFPPIERELEKRGVTNLFHDIKNDNVYVMSDEFVSFEAYYQDHYHETLVVDTVQTFGSLKLLKYREAE